MRMFIERVGRASVNGVIEFGYVVMLLVESLKWILLGYKRRQPVHLSAVAREIVLIGVLAVPIVSVLSFAVGTMLAIQTIHTLKTFGQEGFVVDAVALAVTREFSPLIVGILVAGRSGSAITARIGTMHESQEIDALRVIGINPVRYLGAPVLLAMMIAVPCLAILGDLMGIVGSGLYTSLELGMSMDTYLEKTLNALVWDDLRQGLIKSTVFGMIIAMISVSNGFQVGSGAEGVGRSTTRSVVLAISFIVLADMIFTFYLTH